MKKILILNTGGTIGMTRTEKGYMPDREYFRKALINMDSLRAPGMPVWDLAETEELLDSSNMTVRDWNEIAKILADAYDSYDGFVVLHGTDTMAYTSSALSFMLEELDKPVILTGSQIPLCELRSDGRDNLISSMLPRMDCSLLRRPTIRLWRKPASPSNIIRRRCWTRSKSRSACNCWRKCRSGYSKSSPASSSACSNPL